MFITKKYLIYASELVVLVFMLLSSCLVEMFNFGIFDVHVFMLLCDVFSKNPSQVYTVKLYVTVLRNLRSISCT